MIGHVGDHQVEHAGIAVRAVVAAHAGAQAFAAAVYGFVAVTAKVFFNFYIQVGVAEADFIPHGGTEKGRIFLPGNLGHDDFLFLKYGGLNVWRS